MLVFGTRPEEIPTAVRAEGLSASVFQNILAQKRDEAAGTISKADQWI